MTATDFVWLAAFIVFVCLEAATYQMICIWFMAGAIGGMIASLSGADFLAQMLIFLAVSIILLVLFRPVVVKRLKNKTIATNSDSLVGKSVLITADVSNVDEVGEGKVEGKIWSIRTENGDSLKVGETAVVKRIEGVRLIVE